MPRVKALGNNNSCNNYVQYIIIITWYVLFSSDAIISKTVSTLDKQDVRYTIFYTADHTSIPAYQTLNPDLVRRAAFEDNLDTVLKPNDKSNVLCYPLVNDAASCSSLNTSSNCTTCLLFCMTPHIEYKKKISSNTTIVGVAMNTNTSNDAFTMLSGWVGLHYCVLLWVDNECCVWGQSSCVGLERYDMQEQLGWWSTLVTFCSRVGLGLLMLSQLIKSPACRTSSAWLGLGWVMVTMQCMLFNYSWLFIFGERETLFLLFYVRIIIIYTVALLLSNYYSAC